MLKLKKEFTELFSFFDLDDEAKTKRFQEVLEETMRFSEKIKDRIANGSEEEREELKVFLDELQVKIEEEKNKMFQKIGISEDELKEFLNNRENFSDEEWRSMTEVKDYMKQSINPMEKKPKKIKTKKSKTKWIQS